MVIILGPWYSLRLGPGNYTPPLSSKQGLSDTGQRSIVIVISFTWFLIELCSHGRSERRCGIRGLSIRDGLWFNHVFIYVSEYKGVFLVVCLNTYTYNSAYIDVIFYSSNITVYYLQLPITNLTPASTIYPVASIFSILG